MKKRSGTFYSPRARHSSLTALAKFPSRFANIALGYYFSESKFQRDHESYTEKIYDRAN